MIDRLFVDYETYWGTKYSLRTQGMSYTDYIFDERFQIHGASVAINDEKPYFLREQELEHFLRNEVGTNGQKMRLIAHSMLFDGFITTHFHIPFKEYFCTLAMLDALYQGAISVGLDAVMLKLLDMRGKSDIIKRIKDIRSEDITPEQWEELATYANYDLEATQRLYAGWAPALPQEEHEIMDIILRMFLHPKLEFDTKVLDEAVKEADDDRENRIAPAIKIVGGDREDAIKLLKGNKTFPDFLRAQDITVPMKSSPTVANTQIPALAKTDPGFQAMLESKDESIKALAEGRLAVKSTQATTRAYRFKKLEMILGKLPIAYNYARAHTWRVTGANKINATNLKRGSKLRTCIKAPAGYVLGVADASQIECRSNGYIAGQDSLIAMFRDRQDPYNDMAADIFGEPIDRKGNPDHFFQGFLGKTATLGLGFQMGGPKFKWTVDTKAKVDLGMDIDFDIEEAYRIVNLYRSKNWKIEAQWKTCKRFLFMMLNNEDVEWEYYDSHLRIAGKENKIYFPNGTWLYYPGLDYDNDSFTYVNKQGPHRYITKYIYGGLLCENIIQKFSRDITSWHMTLIAERYPVIMHTYDENVALIPEKEADEGVEWMLDIMKTSPDWAKSLPLDAEGGWAKEYSK